MAVALVLAIAVSDSFEDTTEEGASSMKRIHTTVAPPCECIDIEHSAVERVAIPFQVVDHAGETLRFDGQTFDAYVAGNR